MSRFCKDFKIRKDFRFSLEYERDPLTNKSEADLLEEIAELSHCTVSKIVRDAFLEYAVKNKHLYSKDPKIDHFILDDNNTEIVPIGIPSVLDDWQIWKKYLETCEPEEFFKVLTALRDSREQALTIMKQRDIKKDEEPIRYKPDLHATTRTVPMGEYY